MHLAFLAAGFPKASETFVAREYLGLQREGVRVSAAACGRPGEDDLKRLSPAMRDIVNEVYYLPPAGVRLAVLGTAGGGLGLLTRGRLPEGFRAQSRASLLALRAGALARWVKHQGITQMHAHWPYASMLAYLINQLTGVPYTISVHAHEVAHEDRHFPAVFETVRLATFCNRAAMEYLLKKLPATARAKCHLVYHGVDLDGFSAAPLPPLEKELRILSAGRFTSTKGFPRLVELCAAAKKAGVPVKLTILGEGEQRAEIEDTARRCDFVADLALPGWVSPEIVKKYLVECHLTALLADVTYHDGLPNIVLEGMAVGRPPLLSPLPAASEAVTDRVEGFILRARDGVAEGVAALRRVWTEPGLLEQLAIGARARVRRDHDAQVHIRELAQLLTSPET